VSENFFFLLIIFGGYTPAVFSRLLHALYCLIRSLQTFWACTGIHGVLVALAINNVWMSRVSAVWLGVSQTVGEYQGTAHSRCLPLREDSSVVTLFVGNPTGIRPLTYT